MTIRARIDHEAACLRQWAADDPVACVLAVIGVVLALFGVIGLEAALWGAR